MIEDFTSIDYILFILVGIIFFNLGQLFATQLIELIDRLRAKNKD